MKDEGGKNLHDFEKRFEAEDKGIVKAGDKRFRWKQVLGDNKGSDKDN